MLINFDDPHPPAPSPTLAGAVIAKGRARLRRRTAIAGLAALGLVVLAPLLKNDAEDVVTAVGEPPWESTSVPNPATDGSVRRSPQVLVDGTPTVLMAYVEASGPAGTTGRIDILEWRDSWRAVGSFRGVVVSADAARPLLTEDVTGDGEPDFVVPLEAASTAPYQVVSNDGGPWRQVPFGAPNQITMTDPDDPKPDRFVTSTNLCEPTCAAGHYRRESWRYAAAEGMYLPVESAICDAISEVEWRCDPGPSTLATEEPIGSD
jgi:hypothetical protein